MAPFVRCTILLLLMGVALTEKPAVRWKRFALGGGGLTGVLGGNQPQGGEADAKAECTSDQDDPRCRQQGSSTSSDGLLGGLTSGNASQVFQPAVDAVRAPGDLLLDAVQFTNQRFGLPDDALDDSTITQTFPPEVTERMIDRVVNGLLQSSTPLPVSVPVSRSSIYVPNANPFGRFQSCQSESFGTGHCRYIHHCLLPDLIFNIPRLVKHLCLVNGFIIGVCCPDASYQPWPPKRQPPTQQPSTTRRPTGIGFPSFGGTTAAPAVTAAPKPETTSDIRASCGLNFETRIVGGEEADPSDWLWMAAIIRKAGRKDQFCGGVLITRNHVLSAAHCFVRNTAEMITVRLGEYDFTKSDETETQDYDVSQIVSHPQYDRQSHVNDIAILRLAREASFTTYVRPICLPVPHNHYVGENGTVVGWGTLAYGGPSSKVLRELQVPVWNNTDCDRAFDLPIVDEFMCAGYTDGTRDACQGDSGGPLMLPGPRRRWMVIGVVSWGIRCAEVGYPGVYTRVTEYLEWIHENTQD